jgi:hypothetical protein
MALGSGEPNSQKSASAVHQQDLLAAALTANCGFPLRAVLLISLFTSIALPALLANSTFAWNQFWAVDFWRYVPFPTRSVLVLLFGAALLGFYRLGRPLPMSYFRSLDMLPDSLPAWLPAWLPVPLLGLVFWLLRERTFAGDALLKLIMLDEKGIRTDPYVWKEPLDALLAYTANDLLRPFGVLPADTLALLSVLAGMVYVAAALWLARLLFSATAARCLLFLGLMALGSSQLWFGHIESYSWVTATTYLSVALALAYQKGRVPLWLVGLACGLAVSFHPQAAFTLPALLFLLDRAHWPRQVAQLAASGTIIPLLTASTLLIIGVPLPGPREYTGDLQLFWTPAQALAAPQLWDGIMNLWLLVPGLPFMLLMIAWGMLRPQVRQEPIFHYLTALVCGLLFYNFSFQNDLPRAQDWDLYAIAAPAVALLGCWIGIAHWAADARQQPARHTLLVFCLLFSLLFTCGWIGVNHGYTLVHPDPAHAVLYTRYRYLALEEKLDAARIAPSTAICDVSAHDPTSCQRVAQTFFNIPPDSKDSRPVIFAHAPARIIFTLDLPPEPTFLWLSPALDPYAWHWGGDGVTFRVLVQSNHAGNPETNLGIDVAEHVLVEQHLSPQIPSDLAWQELFVPLADYAGQQVHVILETTPGPAGDASADRAGWGIAWLMRGTVRQ